MAVELKRPQGTVRFAYGKFENLPYEAEEVTLFMVPGDTKIYVVPNNSIPSMFTKMKSESESKILFENEIKI